MISRRLYALTSPFIMKFRNSERFVSQDVIQPAEIEDVTPPWISDSSLDAISGVQPWGNLKREIERIKAQEVTHAPVVRFTHGPGIVGPTGMATRKFGFRISPSFTKNALTHNTSKSRTVTYINDFTKYRFFGHWLLDGITQTELVEDGSYYLTSPEGWSHCKEYRSFLGLRGNDDSYISVDEIVTYSDHSQGSLKRERCRIIKEKLFRLLPNELPSEKVFLWRGDTGKARHFANQGKLKERLQSDGWEILDVTDSLARILSVLSGARVVAGMEGSNLNHAHFCTRPGTVMVNLVPHDKFTAIQIDYARAVGNFCGFYVMRGNHENGYQLDLDALNRAVEQSFAISDRSLGAY